MSQSVTVSLRGVAKLLLRSRNVKYKQSAKYGESMEKVLVVGTGVSGIAAVQLLLKKQVQTVLFDSNANVEVEKLYERAHVVK